MANGNRRAAPVRRVSLGIGRNSGGDFRVRLARGETHGCVNVFIDDEIMLSVYTDGTARAWKVPKASATFNWKNRVQ